MAITKKVLRQRAEKAAAEAKAEADRVLLAEHGMKVGDLIRVEGDRSVFRVFGVGNDGSVTVVDQDHASFRSFRPEWCYPAFRINRRGRKVRTTCPPAKKGLRAKWMDDNGFSALSNREGKAVR